MGQKKRPAVKTAGLFRWRFEWGYVVVRGKTAINCTGTVEFVVHTGFSFDGETTHDGNLGSIVCVSVRLGTSTKCKRLSPEVPTKKVESSGLKAPEMGACAPVESCTFASVPAVPKVVDGV
jgi:hypothetical protein